MDLEDAEGIDRALRLVGELVRARGAHFDIVVIGGAAVNLLGFVSRATTDVDILAFAEADAGGAWRLRPPDEQDPSPAIADIITKVIAYARDIRDRLR